jgi:hypothetical protein
MQIGFIFLVGEFAYRQGFLDDFTGIVLTVQLAFDFSMIIFKSRLPKNSKVQALH